MAGTKKPVLTGLTADEVKALGGLQAALRTEDPRTFEMFCAQLISVLLDVPVHVSKSGYQFGADAGTVGLQGRRLRIEFKRYDELTWTNARSLAGQVEQAGQADPALEAWILMTSKTVTESDRHVLEQAGAVRGIPVIVIDWSARCYKLPLLAALCAENLDIVSAFYGQPAKAAAEALTGHSAADVEALRADVRPWAIGFKELRARSLAKLRDVWDKQNESLNRLNQNAAGGASGVLVHRVAPSNALDAWWASSERFRPVAVCGPEGHGKTWAMLDWMIERQHTLPIILPISSQSLAGNTALDEDAFLNELARFLRGVAESAPLDLTYWRRRVDRLLARPPSEAAAILLFIDGLNQHPSFRWEDVARIVQGDRCRHGVRLAFTVRTSYLEAKRNLEPLSAPITKVPVGGYTTGQGEEREQALRAHGLEPATLHPRLLERAIVPRVLPLIARLKDSQALQSETTVHRILWEYALDEYNLRASRSFSNSEFADWIVTQANRWRDARAAGTTPSGMNRKELVAALQTSTMPADDIDRKLSDLVDGPWLSSEEGFTRIFKPSDDVLTLGLAVALLVQLTNSDASTAEGLHDVLDRWLEPVAAFDETAEIVRTALAIMTKGVASSRDRRVVSALMATWLYAQNPTPNFEGDVLALGSQLPFALLDAMDEASRHANAHAISLAAQALRRVPVNRAQDWAEIEARLEFWCGRLVCPQEEAIEKDASGIKAHDAKRLNDRIGTCKPGDRTVLGVPVRIDHDFDADPLHAVPAILEGHKLENFRRVFVAAAVANAVRSSISHLAWPGIRALVSFAEARVPAVRAALRQWSAEVAAASPEDGVSRQLPARAAALLLWAAGEESDDLEAWALDPGIERRFDYVADYEVNPGGSLFPLEHRHFEDQLAATGLSPFRRLERVRHFLPDPSLTISATALGELEALAAAFDFGRMDLSSQRQAQELRFNDLAAGLARFSAASLTSAIVRRLTVISQADASKKYWGALRAREFLLLVTPQMADALGHCRRTHQVNDAHEEEVANAWLLQVEIPHLTADEQLERIYAVDALLTVDLIDTLRTGGEGMVEWILSRPDATTHAQQLALGYMAQRGQDVTSAIVDLMVRCFASVDEAVRATAAMALYKHAPQRLFQTLLDTGWLAKPKAHFEAHYGSLAFADHGKHLPFEDVAAVIAPWCLLTAAHIRGGLKSEFDQAIAMIDKILFISPPEVELVGDIQLVQEEGIRPTRMRFPDAPHDVSSSWMGDQRSAREINQRNKEFHERVAERVEDLRSQGASLLLQDVDHRPIAAAWDLSSDAMRAWLVGVDQATSDFVRRLRSADGLYFSLCEVLLQKEPALGAKLWWSLRQSLPRRFKGTGGISGLTLMLFRVPTSPEVEHLRLSLLELGQCRSDLDLFEIVVAAQIGGTAAWLSSVARIEAAAEPQWRRKRSILLQGMLGEPAVDAMTWPAGEKRSSWAKIRDGALLWSNSATLARHWWRRFIAAPDAEQAYAAFMVFQSCADRRALAWMDREAADVFKDSALDHLKWSHWRLNLSQLSRSMRKCEDSHSKLSDTLCGQERPSEWLTLDGKSFS